MYEVLCKPSLHRLNLPNCQIVARIQMVRLRNTSCSKRTSCITRHLVVYLLARSHRRSTSIETGWIISVAHRINLPLSTFDHSLHRPSLMGQLSDPKRYSDRCVHCPIWLLLFPHQYHLRFGMQSNVMYGFVADSNCFWICQSLSMNEILESHVPLCIIHNMHRYHQLFQARHDYGNWQ